MQNDQMAAVLPNVGQLADEYLTDEQKKAFKRLSLKNQDYVEGLMRQIWAHEKDGFQITADMVRAELECALETAEHYLSGRKGH